MRRDRKGWNYLKTLGEQKEGPYVHLGSGGGAYGWSYRAGDKEFVAPQDGYEYLAAPYQNQDGSIFMNIYRSQGPASRPKSERTPSRNLK